MPVRCWTISYYATLFCDVLCYVLGDRIPATGRLLARPATHPDLASGPRLRVLGFKV